MARPAALAAAVPQLPGCAVLLQATCLPLLACTCVLVLHLQQFKFAAQVPDVQGLWCLERWLCCAAPSEVTLGYPLQLSHLSGQGVSLSVTAQCQAADILVRPIHVDQCPQRFISCLVLGLLHPDRQWLAGAAELLDLRLSVVS